MDLEKARDWTDFFLKLLTIFAILAGGIWAIYQFEITETTASNIQLTITSESQPYSADSKLLQIHIKPKNIGKVLVAPGKDGLKVTIRLIPKDIKVGFLDLERLPEFYKTDLIKRFPEGYELEPGVEYDEILTFVVPKDTEYAIKAVLDLGDKTEIDQTNITRFSIH